MSHARNKAGRGNAGQAGWVRFLRPPAPNRSSSSSHWRVGVRRSTGRPCSLARAHHTKSLPAGQLPAAGWPSPWPWRPAYAQLNCGRQSMGLRGGMAKGQRTCLMRLHMQCHCHCMVGGGRGVLVVACRARTHARAPDLAANVVLGVGREGCGLPRNQQPPRAACRARRQGRRVARDVEALRPITVVGGSRQGGIPRRECAAALYSCLYVRRGRRVHHEVDQPLLRGAQPPPSKMQNASVACRQRVPNGFSI